MSKRWEIFTVLALMFMLGFFYRVSMAVAARDLSVDLDLSAVQLGVLSGIFFYVFASVQIPLGPVLDRFGGRQVISLLGVVTSCGALLFALAPGYRAALAGRVLLGMGTASVLMGSLKIYTNWFTPREFPKVSGFMLAVGNLGNLFATAPLAHAVTRFGWRNTFLAAAIMQVAITIVVYLIVRDAPATSQPPANPVASAGPSYGGTLQAWRLIFSTPAFWFVALLAFFWYANYMVLLALWGGPYLMEAIGLNRSQAGNILIFTSLGFISGSLLLWKVINLMSGSLKKTIMAGQTLLLAAMTVMLGPAETFSLPLLSAAFFVIGLSSSTGVIIYPLAREMVAHEFTATAMTCVNFFLLMGAASMQHIMGVYIDSFPRSPTGYPPQAYHGAFLIPICGLAGTLILFTLFRGGAAKIKS
ncbi:MAG TPA: MFS transporter [Geobacteraceae bacterium]|nr:MFS transporter [Geobacteraceae bacterium]